MIVGFSLCHIYLVTLSSVASQYIIIFLSCVTLIGPIAPITCQPIALLISGMTSNICNAKISKSISEYLNTTFRMSIDYLFKIFIEIGSLTLTSSFVRPPLAPDLQTADKTLSSLTFFPSDISTHSAST